MPWQLTDDVEAYAAHVLDLLQRSPAEHTVALTVLDGVRAGRFHGPGMVFGWFEQDGAAGPRVTGAASLTPPYGLLIGVLPPGSAQELAAALRSRGVELPDVNGPQEQASRFAQAWIAQAAGAAGVAGPVPTALATSTQMRLRLYALDRLTPPDPSPPGRPRRAREQEEDLLVRWWEAFEAESDSRPVPARELVRGRVAEGLMWLWEAPGGAAVSMACRNAASAGVARVGPVYTPPEHRRKGYGAAVTAACSAAALREDAASVVLFTDLANPTSNAIYQRIGYQPVSDRVLIRFDQARDPSR